MKASQMSGSSLFLKNAQDLAFQPVSQADRRSSAGLASSLLGLGRLRDFGVASSAAAGVVIALCAWPDRSLGDYVLVCANGVVLPCVANIGRPFCITKKSQQLFLLSFLSLETRKEALLHKLLWGR